MLDIRDMLDRDIPVQVMLATKADPAGCERNVGPVRLVSRDATERLIGLESRNGPEIFV